MEKILLVEDLPIIVRGMEQILGKSPLKHIHLTAADTLSKMETMLKADQYKVAIVGIHLDGDKQIDQLLDIVKRYPDTSVIIFSETRPKLPERKMYMAGICGVLDKTATEKEILTAITQVRNGENYISKTVLQNLLLNKDFLYNNFEKLTRREKEVAKLLVQGKKNQQIGMALELRPSTVSTFKTNIFAKLNVKSVIELEHIQQRFNVLS